MAGAVLLDNLLATVPEADFLLPGKARENRVRVPHLCSLLCVCYQLQTPAPAGPEHAKRHCVAQRCVPGWHCYWMRCV